MAYWGTILTCALLAQEAREIPTHVAGGLFRDLRDALLAEAATTPPMIGHPEAGPCFLEADDQPEDSGSIQRAMWCSVETLTTVGYRDVAPATALGKTLAAVVSLVAVPTGILAASFSEVIQKRGKESREPGDRAG